MALVSFSVVVMAIAAAVASPLLFSSTRPSHVLSDKKTPFIGSTLRMKFDVPRSPLGDDVVHAFMMLMYVKQPRALNLRVARMSSLSHSNALEWSQWCQKAYYT